MGKAPWERKEEHGKEAQGMRIKADPGSGFPVAQNP